MKKVLSEKGYRSRAYKDLQEDIGNELIAIRFTAKQVEHLCERCAALVERVRTHEREIMELATSTTRTCRARTSSRCSRATRPTSSGPTKEVATRQGVREALERFQPAVIEQQEADPPAEGSRDPASRT